MNNVNPKKKDQVLKTLAIVGFFGIIALIAWASVQLVNNAPSGFSSLASLAQSVQHYQDQLIKGGSEEAQNNGGFVVTSNETIIDTGETVELNWSTALVPGTYSFTYDCTDGVAIDIVANDGNRSLACDVNYNIGNTNSLTIAIDSQKEQFVDVRYSISFLGTNDTTPHATDSATITVINNDIEPIITENTTEGDNEIVIAVEDLEKSTEDTVEPVEETDDILGEVAGETDSVEEQVVETESEIEQFEQEFTYTIPVSDPNGRTDLSVRYLNVGQIIDTSFFAGPLFSDGQGAIQFEVRNLGTKTSGTWTYKVTLPNNQAYNSVAQDGLKPNERAVITVGFPAPGVTSHQFEVLLNTSSDSNTLNNLFIQPISFN